MTTANRLDRRGRHRIRKRIPCSFLHEGRRCSGFVIDVSEQGLFLQTSGILPAGTELHLELKATPSTPAMELDACVARGRRVPAQLLAHAAGGMGMRVVRAPAEFSKLLSPAS